MTDHYDTLGVPRNATTEEIHAAWRKLRGSAHPDRQGGDPDRMAAINAAYTCLTDEPRRLRYDAMGEDAGGGTLEDEARAALTALFDQAIDSNAVDPVVAVMMRLNETIAQLTAGRVMAAKRVEALVKKRDRIKSKAASNIVHDLIDRKTQQLERDSKMAERGVEVMTLARTLAADYECEPEPPAPQQASFARGRFRSPYSIADFGGV